MYIVVIVLRSDPTHVFKHSVKIASNIVSLLVKSRQYIILSFISFLIPDKSLVNHKFVTIGRWAIC